MHDLRAITAHFDIRGSFVSAKPHGAGHINDSYVATFDQPGRPARYLVQRINPHVFKNAEYVVENIARVTTHLRARGMPSLTLVPTPEGKHLWRDPEGNGWRAYVFVENAESFDVAPSPAHAEEAARAFGQFVVALSDLPGPRLHETIPHFHDTPSRLRALDRAAQEDTKNRAAGAAREIEFAAARTEFAGTLQSLAAQDRIPERIVHNDTKLNNVLFERGACTAACVTDLDTVMPGLALHDFGDMVRTMASPAAEDERELSRVTVRLQIFEALVKGYLASAGPLLNAAEKQHLVDAGIIVALETGARFLADHLSGDTYFKVSRDGHNLDRCRAQFALVGELERNRASMDRIVARHT